jgi:hypothetical protein
MPSLSAPVRTLFVIDELDIGGTEQQIFELVTRLDRHRFTPLVCCFRRVSPCSFCRSAAWSMSVSSGVSSGS